MNLSSADWIWGLALVASAAILGSEVLFVVLRVRGPARLAPWRTRFFWAVTPLLVLVALCVWSARFSAHRSVPVGLAQAYAGAAAQP